MSTYEPQDKYPVIVEETRRYVVWVEGDGQADAVNMFDNDPCDPGRESMFAFDWTASAPSSYDWYHIEHPGRDGNWRGTLADAHVRTHRNHLAAQKQRRDREACAAAGHPVLAGAFGSQLWADYCDTCGRIDPASRTAVAA